MLMALQLMAVSHSPWFSRTAPWMLAPAYSLRTSQQPQRRDTVKWIHMLMDSHTDAVQPHCTLDAGTRVQSA
jgi:hypothetical protein